MNQSPDLTSLATARSVDSLSDRFEAAWKAGKQPQIEEYLALVTADLRTPLLQALLEVEIELQSESGTNVSVDAYRRRFPNDRATVHAALATDIVGSQLARSTSQPSSSELTLPDSSLTVSMNYPDAETSRLGSAPTSEPLLSRIGRFEVKSVLGQGAFGTVYRARDPHLDRDVAVKVPRDGVLATPDDEQRFLREARAAATLNHSGVCPVHEVGKEGNRPYIVMALIEGRTLADVLKSDQQVSAKQAAATVRKIALALDEAHRHGIVHRDLKPGNIMINRRGEPVIMDFGLARLAPQIDVQLTKSGMLVGTPAYMSPEQARGYGKDVGPASDIYSLGVVLYELATRRKPFDGSFAEVLGQILHVEPPAPSSLSKDLDPRLEAIILKAMAKKADERFSTISDLAAALGEFLRDVASPASTAQSDAPLVATVNSSDSSTQIVQEPVQLRRELRQHARRQQVPWRLWFVGLGFLAFTGLLSAVIYRIQTDYGTLVVEIHDDQVAAKLQKNGLVVEDATNNRRFTITQAGPQPESTGTYRVANDQGIRLLVLDDAGLQVGTNEFQLMRGGKTRVRVTLESPADQPADAINSEATNERRVAETMLKFGNVTVRVGGRLLRIEPVDALPADNFRIEEIYVATNDRIADDDLEVLRGLPSLRAIEFVDTPRVTDAGIAHLRDLSELEVLSLVNTQLTDAGLAAIQGLRNLKTLSLAGTQVSDAGLARLRGLSALGVLDVGHTRVTDAGTIHLRDLTQLRDLRLNDNKLGDAGLANIKALTRLRSLALSNTAVTSTSLEHLADLKELEQLLLDRTQVTDEGLDHLKKLVRLRSLMLHNTAVTDAGLAALQPLTNLTELGLGHTHGVTDSGLEQLKGFTALRSLNLCDVPVTDAGVEHLMALTRLEDLHLDATKVSAAGVQRLRAALPKCKIISDHGTFEPSA